MKNITLGYQRKKYLGDIIAKYFELKKENIENIERKVLKKVESLEHLEIISENKDALNFYCNLEESFFDEFEQQLKLSIPKELDYLLSEENVNAKNYIKRCLFYTHFVVYHAIKKEIKNTFLETIENTKFFVPAHYNLGNELIQYRDPFVLYISVNYLKKQGLEEGEIKDEKKYDDLIKNNKRYEEEIEPFKILTDTEWNNLDPDVDKTWHSICN